ncbi:hypothetical protein C8R42DRAFT_643050 [Lentinula raphanica]|nr:hypothetical protein C8R42DRAFT_643050 [Lentinula raphanica]
MGVATHLKDPRVAYPYYGPLRPIPCHHFFGLRRPVWWVPEVHSAATPDLTPTNDSTATTVLYGSDADPVNLSWVGRPGDVKLWIKNYRKPSYRPSLISSSDSFSKQLIAWWSRLVGDLRAPGINGLYSVLICLSWWILEDATEGISTPALKNFISKVHQRMLDLIRNEEDNKDDRASRTLKQSWEEEEPSGREEEDGAESPRPSKIQKV